MKNFPLLALLKIFENIDFVNLIKLRSICKDWKEIIDDNIIIKKLKIKDSTDKYSKIENLIYLDKFKLDSYQLFRKIINSNILRGLKYLDYSYDYDFNDPTRLINLNCFELLEHLVLDIKLKDNYFDQKLIHPNLKYLSVSVYPNSLHFFMEINCPKSEELEIHGAVELSKYDIVYPERIKILKLDVNETYKEYSYDKIDEFTNIEHLEFKFGNFIVSNGIVSKINNFIKLKKISIEYACFANFLNCFSNGYYIDIAKSVRSLLYDLIDHDLISKKQVQFFFNNKEIQSIEQIGKLITKEICSSIR